MRCCVLFFMLCVVLSFVCWQNWQDLLWLWFSLDVCMYNIVQCCMSCNYAACDVVVCGALCIVNSGGCLGLRYLLYPCCWRRLTRSCRFFTVKPYNRFFFVAQRYEYYCPAWRSQCHCAMTNSWRLPVSISYRNRWYSTIPPVPFSIQGVDVYYLLGLAAASCMKSIKGPP